MKKIVSQLDAQGFFAGAVVADESPLEPGVFLIPGGAIDQAPVQDIQQDKRYRPENGAWIAEDAPAPRRRPGPFADADRMAVSAEVQRDVLLQHASLRMAPLQDAVDLEVASNAEKEMLRAWRVYRLAVARVDAAAGMPDWPDLPARD